MRIFQNNTDDESGRPMLFQDFHCIPVPTLDTWQEPGKRQWTLSEAAERWDRSEDDLEALWLACMKPLLVAHRSRAWSSDQGETSGAEALPPQLKLLARWRVRRVPFLMMFEGRCVPSITDVNDAQATVSDPDGPEVSVDRTELMERAFLAGALALFSELTREGLVDVDRVQAVANERGG